MEAWQKELINSLAGKKPGEMVVQMTGRRVGKSALNAAFGKLWNDIYKTGPVSDLVLSEGTVYGATYYCVEPVGGNWTDMIAWTKTTFGDPAEVWEAHKFMWPDCGRWYMNNRRFWFRDEKDRTMFILKWR